MTRIGILDASGAIVEIVHSLAGIDAQHGIVLNVPDAFPDVLDFADGQFVDALDRVEAGLLDGIDRAAEALVERAVPVNPVLQEFRNEKRRELQRWDDEGEARQVTADAYAFLVAEASARAVPVDQVVAEVRAAVGQWRQQGAAVEAIRVAGRASVRAAGTVAGKQAAFAATIQQLEGLTS